MRVRPRWYWGVIALVVYSVIVGAWWKVNAFDYTAVAASSDTLIKGVVVPVATGALFLVILTTWLGWWKPVMRERRVVAPRWTLVVPFLMVVAALMNIATARWSLVSASYILTLVVGVALVGFSEELLTRGLTLIGMRGSVSEGWAWFWTSVLFGLLHGMNALFGQSVGSTLTQIGLAFLGGTVLYVARMSTGLLVVPMVIHAMWDFGSLSTEGTGIDPTPIAGLIYYAAMLLALVAVVVIVRRKNADDAAGSE